MLLLNSFLLTVCEDSTGVFHYKYHKDKNNKMEDKIKQLEAIINVMQAQIKQQQIQIDYLMQHIHDTDTYEDIEGKYQFV